MTTRVSRASAAKENDIVLPVKSATSSKAATTKASLSTQSILQDVTNRQPAPTARATRSSPRTNKAQPSLVEVVKQSSSSSPSTRKRPATTTSLSSAPSTSSSLSSSIAASSSSTDTSTNGNGNKRPRTKEDLRSNESIPSSLVYEDKDDTKTASSSSSSSVRELRAQVKRLTDVNWALNESLTHEKNLSAIRETLLEANQADNIKLTREHAECHERYIKSRESEATTKSALVHLTVMYNTAQTENTIVSEELAKLQRRITGVRGNADDIVVPSVSSLVAPVTDASLQIEVRELRAANTELKATNDQLRHQLAMIAADRVEERSAHGARLSAMVAHQYQEGVRQRDERQRQHDDIEARLVAATSAVTATATATPATTSARGRKGSKGSKGSKGKGGSKKKAKA